MTMAIPATLTRAEPQEHQAQTNIATFRSWGGTWKLTSTERAHRRDIRGPSDFSYTNTRRARSSFCALLGEFSHLTWR